MIFKNISSNINIEDNEFDLIFNKDTQIEAEMNFTPFLVAKMAAHYLANKKGTRILDIGAGAGKFCLIGSACTEANYIGVEQKQSLCNEANRIILQYHLSNIEFIHSNITSISFIEYDAFYFYNSFHENICLLESDNDTSHLNHEFYDKYSFYMKDQLDAMPIGTKLVTYFSYLKEVPASYEVKFSEFEGKLKMWEKLS
ncbi:MAG TPA: methyltransferase domain-containing protein [Saprospiraceae bacterium]|nr:methyltransferase domain-containing protein [Saprospiraceae bacterium]